MAKYIREVEEEFYEAMPATGNRVYGDRGVVAVERDYAAQTVRFIVAVIQVLLGLRLLLRLFQASTASGFVGLVYDLSAPLVQPFLGIFSTEVNLPGFELATVAAMIVYGLIGYLIIRGIRAARGDRDIV